MDVLPELPRELLAPVCSEMARVSRGSVVVVTVCGEDADRSNRRTLDWCRRQGIAPPGWLLDSVDAGVPSVKDIEDALVRHGPMMKAPNTSAAWNERLFRLEHRLRRAHAMTALQPILRMAGRGVPFELPGRGPVYRWRFRLDNHATDSPPPRRS